MGSWKIMEILLPRMVLIFFELKCRRLVLLWQLQKNISPVAFAFEGNSLRSDNAVIDFPDPLSPTSAVILPFSMAKLISFTTVFIIPSFVKITLRFFMVNNGGNYYLPG